MFASARKALEMIFDRAFLGVVLKSLALTLALFFVLFAVAQYGLHHLPVLHPHWLNVVVDWLASVVLVMLFIFLGAPVAAIFASLFLDEIAGAVEKKYYPADAPASGASFSATLIAGLRLAAWVILLNVMLLPADILLPGLGEILSLMVNGWLLGREYFELAALRHMSMSAAGSLRRRHGFGVWAAGCLIAFLAIVPLVNFVAPLFGAAFMAHIFKRYVHEERPV
jgi:CysZ protein